MASSCRDRGRDKQNVLRGSCRECVCVAYISYRGLKCEICRHLPVKHENLDILLSAKAGQSSPEKNYATLDGDDNMKCHWKCPNIAYMDLNTGDASVYCEEHMNLVQQVLPVTAIQNTLPPPVAAVPLTMEACKLPGCSNFCYVDIVSGKAFDCCCRSHYLLMKQQEVLHQSGGLCLLPGCKLPQCGSKEDKSLKGFCGPQHKTQAEGIALLELQPDQKKYQKIAKHFTDCWSRRKGTPPSDKDVAAVFKIFNPKQEAVFTTYAQKLSNPRAEKHYHGTSVKCDLLKNKTACTNQKCGVCGISRRGFDLKYIATNIPRFLRFGKGLYFAPNSSKCHDYTQGIVDYRVMLLCKVAPGNKHTVQNDKTTLTAPPPGYDSVYGASGGSLNYPEIVLYRSEAILPIYAIVYRRDGINQIAK